MPCQSRTPPPQQLFYQTQVPTLQLNKIVCPKLRAKQFYIATVIVTSRIRDNINVAISVIAANMYAEVF